MRPDSDVSYRMGRMGGGFCFQDRRFRLVEKMLEYVISVWMLEWPGSFGVNDSKPSSGELKHR